MLYTMPGNKAQVFAADELCHRCWWFHKEHKVNIQCQMYGLRFWPGQPVRHLSCHAGG